MTDQNAEPPAAGPTPDANPLPHVVDHPALAPPREPDTGYYIRVDRMDLKAISLLILTALALIAAIVIARPVLMPIMLALLVAFVLRPIQNLLTRLGLSPLLGASLILILFALGNYWAITTLAEPAQAWMRQIPQQMRGVERKMRDLLEPVGEMTRVAEQVDKIAIVGGPPKAKVEVATPSMTTAIWSNVRQFLVYALMTLILAFFMLAYGSVVSGRLSARSKAAALAEEIGHHISSYLLTISIINLGLGLCVAGTMAVLGLPNPLLWGAMAAALNFIPYLGAMVGVVTMAFVGIITFDIGIQMAAPPIAYFVLTTLEGNFITPMILGQRFTINPLFILIALIFWGWVWGVPGALMAVPLLMAFKIVCDHIRPMKPVSQMMTL